MRCVRLFPSAGMRHISRGLAGVNEPVSNVPDVIASRRQMNSSAGPDKADEKPAIWRIFVWNLKVVAKSAVVTGNAVWRNARQVVSGFRKWVNAKDGVTIVSSLGLLLIASVFWLIDTVRLHQPAQPISEDGPEYVDITEPDPLLATVSGLQLRLSDIVEYAHQAGKLPENETLTVGEVFERDLVVEAINQFLLARAATRQGAVMSDPDVRTRLNTSRNRILSAAYLREVISSQATEQNAVSLYQSQRENIAFGDELRLRHIVVAERSLAVDILRALREGADFEQIARDISIDKVAAQRDGALGYLSYAQMPPGYPNRAYAMRVGEVSDVFKSGSQYVILRVDGRRPVKPPSFAAVKDEILEFLKLRAIEDALAELRVDADIVLYEPGTATQSAESAAELPGD